MKFPNLNKLKVNYKHLPLFYNLDTVTYLAIESLESFDWVQYFPNLKSLEFSLASMNKSDSYPRFTNKQNPIYKDGLNLNMIPTLEHLHIFCYEKIIGHNIYDYLRPSLLIKSNSLKSLTLIDFQLDEASLNHLPNLTFNKSVRNPRRIEEHMFDLHHWASSSSVDWNICCDSWNEYGDALLDMDHTGTLAWIKGASFKQTRYFNFIEPRWIYKSFRFL